MKYILKVMSKMIFASRSEPVGLNCQPEPACPAGSYITAITFFKSLPAIAFIFLLAACTNMDNAELSERATFIKLYSGIRGIEAAAAELTDDGYIVLGNMTIARDSVITVVFKTDKRGNRTTPIRYYQGGSGNAIKALPNNQGYIIVGERIKTDPGASQTDNIDIISARMLHINSNLDSLSTWYLQDTNPNPTHPKVDYRGVTLTIMPNGKVIILGTHQESLLSPIRPYIQRYSSDLQTVEWYEKFNLIDRSYRNTKSIHYINGSIIWASSIAVEQQNFDFSYVTIPFIQDGLDFTNNDFFGQDVAEQALRVNDIKPSSFSSLGFGVIGSRANSNGNNSNIFFFRTYANGSIIPSTIKFFDVVLSASSQTVTESSSEIQDYGTALTATQDGGYVLAGHFTTTPQVGNGLNDIVLIKIDLFGSLQWLKTLGGNGSETVSTITELDDRSILVCGTNVVGGVPSIFLIRTDQNGEFRNYKE